MQGLWAVILQQRLHEMAQLDSGAVGTSWIAAKLLRWRDEAVSGMAVPELLTMVAL
jgi:hypothetical protein